MLERLEAAHGRRTTRRFGGRLSLDPSHDRGAAGAPAGTIGSSSSTTQRDFRQALSFHPAGPFGWSPADVVFHVTSISECQEHEGHWIELRSGQGRSELLIDGIPIAYGRLPDGTFVLNGHVFGWTGELLVVARRFITFRRRRMEMRSVETCGEAGT
jgi:hypothetical protein